MNYEILSFLRDIANNCEMKWKEHAEGAVIYYEEHACLSAGYLRSTRYNALKQKKLVPEGLSSEPEAVIDTANTSVVIEVSLASHPEVLDEAANLLRKMAMQLRKQL